MAWNRELIDVTRTGQRMRGICQAKGYTVREIRQELCIGSSQSIYVWFWGRGLPTLDNLYLLSRFLDVPMERLVVGRYEPAAERDCVSVCRRAAAKRLRGYADRIGCGEFA